MSRYSYRSKYPIDVSNKKSLDPGSTKLPILENSSNHISEQHVDGPIILATEYKLTVQTKVRPFNPAHAPMQFMRGQQRHTSPPISEPIGKPVSGPNKKDQPLSPIRGDKLNLPTKVENKHTVQTKMEPSNPAQATPLFGPSNDVGEALNTFKEVVRSAPKPQNNFNYTDSKAPIRGRNTGAIDSREAQRRYANPNPSARPSVNYIGTITSTEAADKYGGTPV